MLVLSRKKSERIMIADNIVITIVEIGGKNVRIGIEAPGDIPIVREELYNPPVEPPVEDTVPSIVTASA